MTKLAHKLTSGMLRRGRVRARIAGTAQRPRLSVFISNQHIVAQVIDDVKQHTLAQATTVGVKAVTGSLSAKAAWVGTEVAKKALQSGVTQVVLDRGSRQYKARLHTLAEAARKEGLEF